MAPTLELNHLRARRNQLERLAYLIQRPKGIFRAVAEQPRDFQLRKVLGAKSLRLARRMQRIGRQQQPFRKLGRFGSEQGRLPAAVGLPAQQHPPLHQLAHGGHSSPQPFSVLGHRATGRPLGTLLAERQVASQHRYAPIRQRFCDSHQQRRLRVATSPVSKYEPIARSLRGHMQKPPHPGLIVKATFEPLHSRHSPPPAPILPKLAPPTLQRYTLDPATTEARM